MSATAPQPTTEDRLGPLTRNLPASNWNLTPRRRKETLLPQIVELALEGHSAETIARKVGIPSRTVRHWLQELRQEWIAAAAGGAAEMLAIALARLTTVYREAMQAWRESPPDIEVRLVEDTQVSDGSRPAKQKRSVRTQGRRCNAALLARATAAAKAAFDLRLRAAASLSQTPLPARPARRLPWKRPRRNWTT